MGTPNFELTGRVAVVTGASSGIGEAIALGLAEMGVSVGCLARPSDRLDAVVARIGDSGGTALAAPATVTDQAALTAAIDRVADELGPITLGVNSAGIADAHPAETPALGPCRPRTLRRSGGFLPLGGRFPPGFGERGAGRSVP